MRTFLLSALILLTLPTASAQVLDGYGIRGGAGASNISMNFEEFSSRTSFLVGAYAEFRVSRDMMLVAELELSRRGYEYRPYILGEAELRDLSGTTDIDLVSLPIWLRVSTDITRTIHLFAGFGARVDYLANVRPAEVRRPDGVIILDELGQNIDASFAGGVLVTGGLSFREALPVKARLEFRFSQGLSDISPGLAHESVQYRFFDLGLAIGL